MALKTLIWKRVVEDPPLGRDEIRELKKQRKWITGKRNFKWFPQNENLDLRTKNSILKASPSVVSVESYSGNKPRRQHSGFIIESNNSYSIILTTAKLRKSSTSGSFEADDIEFMVHLSDGRSFEGEFVSCDLHFQIAAIKIQLDTPLPVASLTHINDSVTVDPSHLPLMEEKSQLSPRSTHYLIKRKNKRKLPPRSTHYLIRLKYKKKHSPRSTSFDLIPGEVVIALGRHPIKPYSIMAAPGLFSIDRCNYNCKELFTASCRITECGTGGPLINHYGEVIGICVKDSFSVAFLPINIASLWWEHCKKSGQTRLPWLGMEVTNLFAAPLDTLERIIQKFPDVLDGVIVEEVLPGSSAESAGIKQGDVIVQFCGKTIKSFLELFQSAWNKVGESVELVVMRESDDVALHLSMVLDEVRSK